MKSFKNVILPLVLGLVLVAVSVTSFTLPIYAQTVSSNNTSICLYPTGVSLTIGSTDSSSNNQVSLLQNFLMQKGFLNVPNGVALGYFGNLTRSALASYQASVGISPAVGFFGSITRAYLNTHCGNTTSAVSISSISPTSGPIGTQVTLTGSGFSYDNTVYLDNLPAMHVYRPTMIYNSSIACPVPLSGADNASSFVGCGYNSNTLTFNIPDGLTLSPGIHVLPGPLMIRVVNGSGTSNNITFNVTDSSNSAVNISSINPSSGAVGTQVTIYGAGFSATTNNIIKFGNYSITPTYSELAQPCFAGASQCPNLPLLQFTIPQYAGLYCPPNQACPALAAQITPGTYPVSVINSNGTSNSLNFTVTSTSSNSGSAPVINGVSSPTTLSVNQTGSWTINATDPQNGTLTYSVNWGDKAQCASNNSCGAFMQDSNGNSASNVSTQQTSTFTHAYAAAGTYNVIFTVTNSAGLSAETSMTVNVSGSVGSNGTPHISYISPTSGPTGTYVTLTGSGFGPNGNQINFGSYSEYGLSNLGSNNGATLSFYIPSGDDYACQHSYPSCEIANRNIPPGTYNISVTTRGGTSNTVTFTVTGTSR